MGKIWKRSISFFLALVMVMSVIPMGAFAVEEDEIREEPADSSDYSEGIIPEDQIIGDETPEEDEEEEDLEEYEDLPEEDSGAVFLLEGEEELQPDGIVWVDADESTTVDEMLPIALDGGIKFAVLRALDLYDERDNYTVKYDGMDVGSSRVLITQAKKAEALAEDMKASVKSGNLLEFEVVDNNGSSAFYLIKLKSFKNTDINETVAIREKVSPDDLDAAVESEIRAGITVDGIAIADLPEDCVQVEIEKDYTWPADGKTKTYTGVVTATITEGMTGETKTVSGGTVTLQDTTQFYTVSYMIDANKAYKTYTLVEGSELPAAPANPTKQYYNLVKWEMTEGSVGADGLQCDVVFTAKWNPKLDNHTPGVNNTPDGIADQEQKFVITFRDDVNGSNTVEQELLYGSAIERPDPTVVPDGYVFNGWLYESGVKANIVKGNTTYKAQWSAKLTYTDGVEEDEVVFADKVVTKRLGTTISHIDVPAQREGFTFGGWKLIAGTKGENNTITGPLTYAAVWEAVTTEPDPDPSTPTTPSEPEEDLEHPDDNPVVEPEYITVTYSMEVNGKWYDNEEVVPKNSNGFLGWYATEDPVDDDTVVLGWYPARMIDNVLYVVFKNAGGSASPDLLAVIESDDGEILVPLDEVDEYIKNNPVSPPYNFADPLAADLQLVLVTGTDTTDDGKNNIDGGYEYTFGTTEVEAADGQKYTVNTGLTLVTKDDEPVRNVISYYRFYDETGALIEMLNQTKTGEDAEQYLPNLVKNTDFVYHNENPKVKFVEWELTKTDGNPETDGVVTYEVHPVTAPDEDMNDVFDSNEDLEILVNENEELDLTKLAEEGTIQVANMGTITVTKLDDGISMLSELEDDYAISKTESGEFVFDTVRGIKIEVKGEGNAVPTKIKVYDITDPSAAVESGKPKDGVLTLELAMDAEKKAKEELDTTGEANYTMVVYFSEVPVDEDAYLVVDAETYNKFTDAEVYEAVTGEADDSASVAYVARKADSVDVSVEPIFQWMADNYSDRMVTMLDSFLGEYSGINTDANGNHYVTVTYETDVVKSLDYASKYWTAQDVANLYVKDYIRRFVAVMESDPARAESDMAPIDMINDLLQLAYKINKEAVASADLHTFGYNAEGADTFTETVTLSKTEYDVEVSRDVTVNLKDNRAVSGLTAKGNLNITYGKENVTTAITGNVTSDATVTVPVDFSNQPAGVYTDVAVVVPGGSQYRPARAEFTLTIERATANVNVPALVIKDHTSDWDGENNPDATVTPEDAEVISVIAGLDLTAADLDKPVSIEDLINKDFDVAGVDPVIWIRLSNTVINLIELMKQMDDYMPDELREVVNKINVNGSNYSTIDGGVNKLLENLEKITSYLGITLGEETKNQIEYIANRVTTGLDGDIKVCFSDGYPENPGMYLNVAIVADANYKHGICKSTENKDFGVILVSPVLAMPNNGIELYTEVENEDGTTEKAAHLVFMEVHDGQPHALKVMDAATKQDVDAEVYYYGFNNELAVHYEGGQTAPTKAGMYIVTAIHEDKTDMAVMLVGMERSTVEIPTLSNMVYEEGVQHRPEIKAYGEYDADKTLDNPSIARTVISGEVEVDGIGLKDLHGNVNIDLPARLDQAWPSVVEYMEAKTGRDLNNDITEVKLTPVEANQFLQWCQDQIASDIIDAKLDKWRNLIPDRLLDTDRPESLAIRGLQEIIDAVNVVIKETNDSVISITFENNKKYEEPGFYLYYAIVTDPNYLPSMDAGIMSIGISEEDFQLVDTYVPYNGKEQDLTPYVYNSERSYLAIVQDGNNYNILLDSVKEQAILEKLEKELGITSSTDGKTFTVQQLYNYAQSKTTTKAKALVDLIVEAVQERALDRIENEKLQDGVEKTEEELEKARTYVKNHIPGLTADLYEALADIDKLNMTDTITINGKKPVDVGTYKYRVISYAIAYREADLIIEPVYVGYAADDAIMTYGGEAPTLEGDPFYYSFAGNAIEGKNRKDLTKADLAGIEIPELSSELTVKEGDITTLNVGTYDIVPELKGLDPESKNFEIGEARNGELEVKPVQVEVTLYDNSKYYGEADPELTSTVKYFDHEGNELADAGAATVIIDRVDGEDKGEYAISADVELSSENYALTAEPAVAVFTIKPVAITVEIDNAEPIYFGDEIPTEFAHEVVFPDDLSEGAKAKILDEMDLTVVRDSDSKDAGTYAIIADYTKSEKGNYTVTDDKGSLEIKPAEVKITVKNADKIYGSEDPTIDYDFEVINGNVTEEQIDLKLDRAPGLNAGTYKYTVSYTESKNWTITEETGALTINQRPIQITMKDDISIYGLEDPEFTYTITDGELVNGDTKLLVEPTRNAGTNVGLYEITAIDNDPNYEVTVVPGTLQITGAYVDIVIHEKHMTYGDETPAFTAEANVKFGKLTEEEIQNILKNLTLKAGTIDGTKWTNWEGDAGEYDITHTGDYFFMYNKNYAFSITTGKLYVEKKAATVTADNVTCFEGDEFELTYTADGLVADDADAVKLVIKDSNGNEVAKEDVKAGEYDIVPVVSENYDATINNAALTVKKKIAVTVKAEVNPAKVNVAAATLPTVTVTAKDADGKDVAGLIDQSYIINGDEALTLTDAVAAAGTYTITPKYDETVKGYIVTVESAELVVAEYAAYNEVAKEYYFTLQEAVDDAAENGVITLLKDGETAIVGKTITILREHEGTKYEATVSALKDYTVIEDEGQTRYEVKEAKALEDETDEPAFAYIDLEVDGYTGEEILPLQTALDTAALTANASNEVRVRLYPNYDEDYVAGTVIIPGYVVLDIQSFTLKANYMVGLDGSKLTANYNDKGGESGHLVIKKENLSLAEECYTTEVSSFGIYGILPVWNTDEGWYEFVLARAYYDPANVGSHRLTVTDDQIYFQFRHQVNKYYRNAGTPLYDGGLDNGVKVVLTLAWRNDLGEAQQSFVYNENFFTQVNNSTSMDYTFKLDSYDKVGVVLGNPEMPVTITAAIITDCGVAHYIDTVNVSMN